MHTTSYTSRIGATLAALFLATSLVACGGGGGGGGDSTSPVTPAPPAPAPSPSSSDTFPSAGNLQKTAATSTYTASSFEDQFYTALNVARSGAGAGALNQSHFLDVASAAHAKYVNLNMASLTDFHVETYGKPGYYGDTFSARDTNAGYPTSAIGTEVVGGGQSGTDAAYGLLNTVYHGAALLSESTDVGVGTSTDSAGFPLVVSDLGAPPSLIHGQHAATGSFITYPFSGQANALGTCYAGSEIPRISTDLIPTDTAGTPVIVNIANADWVNAAIRGNLSPIVTRFELQDASGNTVPSVIVANSNIVGMGGVTITADSNLGDGFVVLVPKSPLTSGATYTVVFSASLGYTDAMPLSKVWSFSILEGTGVPAAAKNMLTAR